MTDSKDNIGASDAVGNDVKTDAHETPQPLHPAAMDERDHPAKSMNGVIYNAKSATEKEHRMTLWQGIRLYPKAVGWSVLISTCICMEAYDLCLLSNFCEVLFFDLRFPEILKT